ncbi:hypothetical protein ACFPTR_09925 [Aliibacillus thermotolerans]|uniref:DUF2802 domain-containing protein n=1 Tax=Aliibacillus thermotolerans TaxID=1834418 RepID=A0ABW0U8P2_9BACI|nr:hypothetical protein [Aliibacillus thermotolerans]MDA3131090.1 hypothetical protein [Aliibacillus thermotolerans]
MEWLIIALFTASFILFLLSFIIKDKAQERTETVEELSLKVMGEMYQLKKRVKLLEEELLSVSPSPLSTKELEMEAYDFYQQNLSMEDIAQRMGLHTNEVEQLLKKYTKGNSQ